MLLAVACGGDGGPAPTLAPTATPQPTAPPQLTASPQPTPTPQPLATPTSPAAATPTPAPTPTPIPPAEDLVAKGKEIFLNAPANVGVQALWCSQCHQIDGVAAGLIGPDLTDIGTIAATRKPGMSAEGLYPGVHKAARGFCGDRSGASHCWADDRGNCRKTDG